MAKRKQHPVMATVEVAQQAPQTNALARYPRAPFTLTKDESEFFAVEQITKHMLESDWDAGRDAEEIAQAYKLTPRQVEQCIREAQRNMRRSIMRPQSAHQLVASTLARVIAESFEQGDLRGAADAAAKLSTATGTQAALKLKVLETQQRMDQMRTRLLTGQATAEEVADLVVKDLLGQD